MTVNTTSGVTISIGPVPAQKLPTLAQYQALAYTPVGEVESVGNFGDKSSAVNFTSLADARVRKFKGSRDAGDMTVTAGDDPNDQGQLAMLAAQDTQFDYCFKVVLNDQVTPTGKPSEHYFYGKVMSKELASGAVNNIVKRNFGVGINSPIVETASS